MPAFASVYATFVKIGTGRAGQITYWDIDEQKLKPLDHLGAGSSVTELLADEHWGPALRLLSSPTSRLHYLILTY